MAKKPTSETIAADLTAQERIALFKIEKNPNWSPWPGGANELIDLLRKRLIRRERSGDLILTALGLAIVRSSWPHGLDTEARDLAGRPADPAYYGTSHDGTGAFNTAAFDAAAFGGNTNAPAESPPASPPYVPPSYPQLRAAATALGLQIGAHEPTDAFERAAVEALLNPDPAIEKEIAESPFQKGQNDPEETLPVTLINDRGERIGEIASNPNVKGGIYAPVGARGSRREPTIRAPANEGKSTGKPEKPRRMRTVVGRSMRANNVTIVLSIGSLVLLIDEKLASLRNERPNHPDAQASRDDAIAEYQRIKRDLELLRNVAIEVKQEKANDKSATKVASTFMDGVRKTWEKRYEEICTKAFDATLFVSCVSLCSLVGCGGAAAVAVSGALVGGKPVIDALRTLPKRLFK